MSRCWKHERLSQVVQENKVRRLLEELLLVSETYQTKYGNEIRPSRVHHLHEKRWQIKVTYNRWLFSADVLHPFVVGDLFVVAQQVQLVSSNSRFQYWSHSYALCVSARPRCQCQLGRSLCSWFRPAPGLEPRCTSSYLPPRFKLNVTLRFLLSVQFPLTSSIQF